MSLLQRTLRALLLVLLLPALLVPSGLGLSVCLCSDMGASSSSAASVPSCCAERGAVTTDDVCPRIGRNAQHTCDECRHFQTGKRELATTAAKSIQGPLACLSAPTSSYTLDVPRSPSFARRACNTNALAPPGSARYLPLRI